METTIMWGLGVILIFLVLCVFIFLAAVFKAYSSYRKCSKLEH